MVALVAATTAAVVARHDNDHIADGWTEGGPVRLPWAHSWVVRKDVGDVFTDGMERILLTGDQPATLRRVEIVGPSADHFKVVGVLLAGPHRKIGSWQLGDGFPAQIPRRFGPHPLGKLVPAEGARLAPGKVGSALQIGLKVVKPGLGIRSGVRLYYTAGEQRYTVLYPAAIANCPPSMTDDACQDASLAAAKQR